MVSLPVAELNEVNLSLERYYLGMPGIESPNVQTFEYARADSLILQLDVYQPHAPATTAQKPAVVVVHGGSWNGGERSDFPQWNAWLVAEGFVVFDIDYQLSPQPRASAR